MDIGGLIAHLPLHLLLDLLMHHIGDLSRGLGNLLLRPVVGRSADIGNIAIGLEDLIECSRLAD